MLYLEVNLRFATKEMHFFLRTKRINCVYNLSILKYKRETFRMSILYETEIAIRSTIPQTLNSVLR